MSKTNHPTNTPGPVNSSAVVRALRDSVVRFGDVEVPCHVLPDGTDLITARGILRNFAGGKEGDIGRFLARIPGVPSGFSLVASTRFRLAGNNAIADGYRAEVLVDICTFYVRASADLADFRMRFNAAFRGGGLQLSFGGVAS